MIINDSILTGKYGSNNGFDGVYIKGTVDNPSEIVIVESKQFRYTNGVADDLIEHNGVTLNPPYDPTGLPSQMSDEWIKGDNRLVDAVGDRNLAKLIEESNYKRILAETAPDGSVIYKELDANANIIGISNP